MPHKSADNSSYQCNKAIVLHPVCLLLTMYPVHSDETLIKILTIKFF